MVADKLASASNDSSGTSAVDRPTVVDLDLRSPQAQHQQNLRRVMQARLVGLVAAALSLGLLFANDELSFLLDVSGLPIYQDLFSAVLTLIGVVLLITAVMTLTISWYRYELTRSTAREAEQESKKNEVDEAFEQVRRSMSLENLIFANRKLIDEYHNITKEQAEDSYRKSQMAMIVAFIVLVAGAVTAIRVDSTTSKLVVGGLTAIGTILSGFISRTFLRAQDSAVVQLNYYFNQPLVTSYLLAAERVTENMSPAIRDNVYMKIVDRLLTDPVLGAPPGRPRPPRTNRRPAASGAEAKAIQTQSEK